MANDSLSPTDDIDWDLKGGSRSAMYNRAIVESKLANKSRRVLLEAAKRLTREERLHTFVRHSKLVIDLAEAGRRVRAKARGNG